jgi:sulfur carrier protein
MVCYRIFLINPRFPDVMDAYIEKDKKDISLAYKGKVSLLLKKLQINPETVIVVRDDELLTDDDLVKDKDKLKIMSVISGG